MSIQKIITGTGWKLVDENGATVEEWIDGGEGPTCEPTVESPYVESDGGDWSHAGSSSSSSSPILVASVNIPHAQILTLPTIAVQLVAAPGVGKYLVPFAWSMDWDRSAGAYTNVTTSDLTQDASKIRIAHGTFGPDALRPCPMEGISGSHGTKRVGYGSGTYNVDDPVVVENQIYIPVFSFPFNGSDRLENLPISVCADNAGGNFTGGGAGNFLTVTIWYAIRTWGSTSN